MKKRLIVSLVVAMTLLATMAAPAMAAVEQTAPATVTINEVVSITITDQGDAGITFGSLSANTANATDTGQDAGQAGITVNVGPETNVTVKLGIKGSDFTAPGPLTIAINNAKWSTTFAGTKTDLGTTFAEFATGLTSGQSQGLWHWLNVPAAQAAGAYSSSFTYKVAKTGNPF